jgi:hypothetical protein
LRDKRLTETRFCFKLKIQQGLPSETSAIKAEQFCENIQNENHSSIRCNSRNCLGYSNSCSPPAAPVKPVAPPAAPKTNPIPTTQSNKAALPNPNVIPPKAGAPTKSVESIKQDLAVQASQNKVQKVDFSDAKTKDFQPKRDKFESMSAKPAAAPARSDSSVRGSGTPASQARYARVV